ncbi:heterokaryon incompatibility protein-domain-containing protein [Colletotrichum lupini]|nr:heterokaryon incompatibility protein-domain-containing protein [Colletotrichum lupini]
MSRYFPHTAYAEDQPLAGTILTVHVLTRGYTTGTVVGLGVAAASGAARRLRGTKPVPATAVAGTPFSTSATTALRSAGGLRTLLRKSGTASAVGLGLTGVATVARMYGREDIEWRDRAWRLMESRSQLEVDDWTYGGAAAGVAALGIARAADCEICHQIWTRLTTSPSGKYHDTVNLGSFEEALSSKCSRHVPIVRMFHELCSKSRQLKSLDSADVGIRFPRTGALQLTENIKTGGRYADLLLVKRDSIPSHPGIARILDPEWIDTSVVTPWKQQCASSHGPKCANPVKIWPIRPAWVVDTERRCIVPGDGCESYVTLSYRWGKTPGLHILGDTISKLQTPGDIDDPFIASQLAPMVRHAVHLTSVIGERYLWVDTLCINHARAEESNQQLQLMAAIFANASLTIVALDGDAEDGFPGLRGEFKMSPRRLIVSNHSLHWMCQCSVWEEQLHLGVEAGKYIDPRLGEIMRGMPNLDSLANIVVDYNPRALTYDEDALPSISGLLHVISRCFSGGFLYGIPEMYFEAALGWTPYWCHTDLRRRTVSDRPTASQLGPCGLPSWSWVGWEGLVSVGRNEAGPANPLAYSIRETIPITTWYACATPTSAQRRKIRSSWFENRQAYKDFTRPLPPGWTRQEIPGHGEEGDVLLYPDGCDKYTFRHSSMSDHDDEHPWYWPFPVPDIQESTQPFMPEQTLYISCDTRRARVSAFQADEHNDVSLYSEEKKIGGLRLHNKGQLESFPQLDAGWAAAKEVELVAISRVRNYKKTFDETIKRYTHPFTASEVYSVLWVEWIDGVAYRLASGHVDKTAWEGLPLEDVSLILG